MMNEPHKETYMTHPRHGANFFGDDQVELATSRGWVKSALPSADQIREIKAKVRAEAESEEGKVLMERVAAQNAEREAQLRAEIESKVRAELEAKIRAELVEKAAAAKHSATLKLPAKG